MDALSLIEPRIDNFLYLNRDNKWRDFHWRGLEVRDDGALQLTPLPLFAGQPLEHIEAPEGPAGIAQAPDGTIYFSDPANHQLNRIGCDGLLTVLRCAGGEGSTPSQLDTPRGLFISKYRRAIFVADSNNHRIQIFDLESGQLVHMLGQSSGMSGPHASIVTGRFNIPWTLTGDNDGNVYVVDYGNRRVQKFDYLGQVIESFWEILAAAHVLKQPSDIAARSQNNEVRLYIVDRTAHAIFVVDGDGYLLRDEHNQPICIGAAQLKNPMGIAVDRDAIYVGDNELHRILKFSVADHSFLGEAVGYEGPVAGLALNDQGTLLVNTGGTGAPLQLPIEGYASRGMLWSNAISASTAKVSWHGVQAQSGRLPANVHLRLFFHTSNDVNDRPRVDPDAVDPFADPRWKPRDGSPDPFIDAHDVFIGGPPTGFLWIGALFLSDGRDTPVVPQMLVEFDHDGYIVELPALYQTESRSRDFLVRFLALTETLFQDLETSIRDLPRLFDPHAVPKEFLPWLATWLALSLDENRDEQEQRQLIASAFERYGRRGTVAGLRESLRLFAGVNAIIQEPVLNAEWWSLPSPVETCGCHKARAKTKEPELQATENSILGVTTMLAAAQPQGAVVGTTATLDYSNLITNEEFGTPLFEDVAHQFTVQISSAELRCPEVESYVRRVLDREKPAHTDYHLCTIQPLMRVGFQATVGIDAVVGDSVKHSSALGSDSYEGLVLSGEPPARLGNQSRVGIATRVG